jgi:hypothetical protein
MMDCPFLRFWPRVVTCGILPRAVFLFEQATVACASHIHVADLFPSDVQSRREIGWGERVRSRWLFCHRVHLHIPPNVRAGLLLRYQLCNKLYLGDWIHACTVPSRRGCGDVGRKDWY